MSIVLKRLVLLFASIFVLSGCASAVGKKIEGASVSRIQKDKTTKQEIIEIFGSPIKKTFTSEGEVWQYYFQSSVSALQAYKSAFGGGQGDFEVQKLDVLFANGVVKDFGFSTSGGGTTSTAAN